MVGEFFWFLLACAGFGWMLCDINRRKRKGFSFRNKHGMKIDVTAHSIGYEFEDEQTRDAFWDNVFKTINSPHHQEISRQSREKGSYTVRV